MAAFILAPRAWQRAKNVGTETQFFISFAPNNYNNPNYFTYFDIFMDDQSKCHKSNTHPIQCRFENAIHTHTNNTREIVY